MIRRIACLILLACFLSSAYAQSSAETTVDYVLLVDVSGSMVGQPAGSGNANIFPEVKESLIEFVGELESGTSVFVGPFSGGLEGFQRFDIRGQSDIKEAQEYVNRLRATGANTYVYRSLLSAMDQYNGFRAEAPNERVGVLMVYTDGKDNGPGNRSMADVLAQFRDMRQQNDWLYYATLGVELDADDRSAIRDSDVATLVSNPRGEVRPIRIVAPRYSVLDFGNLLANPEAERTLKFDVRSSEGFPEGLELHASASFESIMDQGAAVEVRPEQIDPTSSAQLSLQLVNEESLGQGFYKGYLQFESSDPSVVVAPGQVETRFRYEPRRLVKVERPSDEEALQLGTLDPFRSNSAVVDTQLSFPLEYSEPAQERGGSFSVEVGQDEEAASLPREAFRINGQEGSRHEVRVEDGSSLTFGIQVSDEVDPGTYRGALLLSGNAVEIDSASQRIPWQVVVASPPLTAGQWAMRILVLLALALLLGYAIYLIAHRVRKDRWPWDTLQGRLAVVKPTSELGRDVVLDGRKALRIGQGGEDLADAEAAVLLRPRRNGKKVLVEAAVEEGTASFTEQGGLDGSPFGKQTLREGDQLHLSPYTLEYNRL